MPKGPHEYTHNDSGETHINFLRFKKKKAKFRKEDSVLSPGYYTYLLSGNRNRK